MGTELTRRLIEEACDKGLRYLYGLVIPKNRRMLHLLRDLGLPEREREEDGFNRFEVDLQREEH